ncbi:TetR/AcrR family transcriptional regulator C-terminal ligand-binding domain-containing protein [Streptomyces sp. NPDC020096]
MEVNDPPRVRRTGGRSARVRSAVLTAAVDALLDRGIDNLAIGEVARRARVHESSIYRRWKTKSNLAVSAVLSRTDAALPAPDTGSLRGDLLALLRGIAEFVTTPLGGLLMQLALRRDMPEYEAVREKFRTERFNAGMAVLERAGRRGELREGIDHRVVLETAIGPLYVRMLITGEPLGEEFVAAVVDLLLAGIAAGPAAHDELDRT